MEKKIGRMRFSLPGLASGRYQALRRNQRTIAGQQSAESLKKPIQPVLPIFGSTIAAANDRPKNALPRRR